MSLFALNLPESRLAGPAGRVALAGVLAAVAGAMAAQAAVQPQIVEFGVLLICATVLLGLAARLPPAALPLALVVGLLGLGNLELGRVLSIPFVGGQEKWVLLVLVGVAVLGAAADASAERRPAWPPTLLLGVLFLLVSVGSPFYAADRELAGPAVIHQAVQMAALAAGFFWVRRAREADALTISLVAAGVVSAVLGLWQFFSPAAFDGVFGVYLSPDLASLMRLWAEDFRRVGALWVFAPSFAAFLSAVVPFLFYLLLRRRSGLTALAVGVSLAMTATALALTGTRVAFLGAVAGLCVLLALWQRRRPRGARVGWTIVVVLVSGVVIASVLSASRGSDASVLGRITSLFGTEGQASVSVTGRRDIYGTLLDLWRSNLWMGVGLGNAGPAIEEITTYNSTPHAYWLGLLAETGLVGAGLVALMLAGMVPHYRRLLKRPPERPERAFGALALAASTALLVGGLFDNAMLIWQIGVLFWLLQGAVLSLSLRCEDRINIGSEEHSMQEAGNAR